MNDLTDNRLEAVFLFTDNVFNTLDLEIGQTFSELSALSEAVGKESLKWAEKLPYHINLLDIWNPEETDHSRILLHILRYRTPEGCYEWVESLINFIKEKYGKFLEIAVRTPHMTAEKEKIDVCIQEREKYAIILENKSNWAGDQPNQLARYIKKLRDHHQYRENQIYVLYLPPYSIKEPESQSWIDPDDPQTDFKERFESRFVNFSFNDSVIPWLKQRVLPNVRNRDAYLLSFLTQYVDYWEGLFCQRTDEKEKNMSIETVVREQLGVSAEHSDLGRINEDLKTVQQKMSEFNTVMGCLAKLKRNMAINLQLGFWQELAQQLQHRGYMVETDARLRETVSAFCSEDKNVYPALEFPFYIAKTTKKTYLFRIEIGGWGGLGYYYGVRKGKNGESDMAFEDCLNKHLGGFTGNSWWFSLKSPSQEYALNWRTLNSPGFNDFASASLQERETFIGGLADEIDGYMKGVVMAARENGI